MNNNGLTAADVMEDFENRRSDSLNFLFLFSTFWEPGPGVL